MSDEDIKRDLESGRFDDKEIDIKVKPANALGDMFQGMGIVGIESNMPPDIGKLFGGQGKNKQ